MLVKSLSTVFVVIVLVYVLMAWSHITNRKQLFAIALWAIGTLGLVAAVIIIAIIWS